MERIIAFDVETPNTWNDRISAIGITVIEDGRIARGYTSLVNPETHFDPFNISLTGITPDMVRTAPTFPELWRQIGPVLQSGILLAHNAPFDLRVLACCLKDYGIPGPRTVRYACTVRMGRTCYPGLPNHRMDTLCRRCRIPLSHHQADSDSRACAALFLDYLQNGLSITPFLRQYDLETMRTLR